MINIEKMPAVIAEKIKGKAYRNEDIGRSGSTVLIFDDMVLKIEKTSTVSDNEYAILSWLDGKLPAPRVLAFTREGGCNFLLMTRLFGMMACEKGQALDAVVRGLADGLKMLWTVDISDCPISWDVENKLALAKENLKRLRGKPNGTEFADFSSLYEYLSEHRPSEELVFSHGDYCLPNVFLSGEKPVGFLDLGSAGIADKWYDIAICLWSLSYNFCELGEMGEDEVEVYKALFLSELGVELDEDKMRYYNLLDEFFV